MLRHPDEARKQVEERIEIDPSGRGNYGFLFMTESLLIRSLMSSEDKRCRESELVRGAMFSLKDNLDEASGGFYGHRVFSWSTAKAISALSVTEMRDAKFPRRRPEYAGQKAGGPFIFVAVLLLAFYTYDLTVKNLLGLPQVVFLIFFMLALLLAYERIRGKFFQELVQGLLELLKSKWD